MLKNTVTQALALAIALACTFMFMFRVYPIHPILTLLFIAVGLVIVGITFPRAIKWVFKFLSLCIVRNSLIVILVIALTIWSSGIAGAILVAKNAPENEFGSWGEWLNIPLTITSILASSFLGYVVYRVTIRQTDVAVRQVISEFLRETSQKISPDGRTYDATYFTSRLVTSQFATILHSNEMMTPEILAMIFRSLSGMYALTNVQFSASAGQQNTDPIDGLPIPLYWKNPYENRIGTKVLKIINLLSLRDVLKGKSLKNQSLKEVDLSWGVYQEMDFSGCNMMGTVLFGSSFFNCDFSGADLTGARIVLTVDELGDAEADIRRHQTPFDRSLLPPRFVNSLFNGATVSQDLFDILADQRDQNSQSFSDMIVL